ncbi:hypothetical protein BDZ94DRAFT_163299 [Collybia nuda]|uniref:Uncharacterized protein n=1 Tax=Collybia nuda TaxID=64659 RepID=A0A9P5XYA7_9AGAR|nr:hypothetical protein BDZ94DRAFT_163299 [Collybia nuda]
MGVSSSRCQDIDDCRTLISIIWSCIATLVACTWVSVHPNVPSPHHGTTTLVLRRMRLMLLAIIAPEIIVLWALRQRMVARDLRKKFDIPVVYGFFVSMGGVVQPEGYNLHPVASHLLAEEVEMKKYDRGNGVASRPQTVVGGIRIPVEFLVHIQEIIDIDHREIRDRSEGDGISKGIAFLQTLWFMVQCIARARQHLPLTEFEVVTLAFASLNVVIRLIRTVEQTYGYRISYKRSRRRKRTYQGQRQQLRVPLRGINS